MYCVVYFVPSCKWSWWYKWQPVAILKAAFCADYTINQPVSHMWLPYWSNIVYYRATNCFVRFHDCFFTFSEFVTYFLCYTFQYIDFAPVDAKNVWRPRKYSISTVCVWFVENKFASEIMLKSVFKYVYWTCHNSVTISLSLYQVAGVDGKIYVYIHVYGGSNER